MRDIYTNSNEPPKNSFYFVFKELAINNDLFFAIPFFTKADVLEEALAKGCEIHLIVKLGDRGTNPDALKKLINSPNIHIRFFTKRFHSKLYIFGQECAFVGSSNLTNNGLLLNSEINVKIPFDDSRFESLKDTFDGYWKSAKPLTKDVLNEYISLYDKLSLRVEKDSLNAESLKLLGVIQAESRIKDLNKKDKKEEFIKKYMQEYQVFLKKFAELKNIYERLGFRKVSEAELPLRLEIDQFLSWIRENKAEGTSYLMAPLREGTNLNQFLKINVKEFIEDTNFTYIDKITSEIYPLIQDYLSSKKRIDLLNDNEIFELFYSINAFRASSRYHGTKEIVRTDFFKVNNIEKIKNMLKYLFFGTDSYEKRIVNCKHNHQYSLERFGESGIKELFGWANKNNIPIYNERTAKSMQWLGFGKT